MTGIGQYSAFLEGGFPLCPNCLENGLSGAMPQSALAGCKTRAEEIAVQISHGLKCMKCRWVSAEYEAKCAAMVGEANDLVDCLHSTFVPADPAPEVLKIAYAKISRRYQLLGRYRLTVDWAPPSPGNRMIWTNTGPLASAEMAKDYLSKWTPLLALDWDHPDLRVTQEVNYEDGKGWQDFSVLKSPRRVTPEEISGDREAASVDRQAVPGLRPDPGPPPERAGDGPQAP